MKISDKDIEKLAEFAKIELRGNDKEELRKNLSEITELFKDVEELVVTKDAQDYDFCELRSDSKENEFNESGSVFTVPRIVG